MEWKWISLFPPFSLSLRFFREGKGRKRVWRRRKIWEKRKREEKKNGENRRRNKFPAILRRKTGRGGRVFSPMHFSRGSPSFSRLPCQGSPRKRAESGEGDVSRKDVRRTDDCAEIRSRMPRGQLGQQDEQIIRMNFSFRNQLFHGHFHQRMRAFLKGQVPRIHPV